MKLIFKKSEYIKYETASESETRCDNSAGNTKALMREAGLSAGVCYLPETYDELQKEDTEKSEARYNKAIENGHDSITGHITVSLIAQDTPKIIAMMLNNEKEYNTSEKSGRYTVMTSANGNEMQRYEKWVDKLTKLLNSRYGDKWTVREIKTAAQENARLHLSVFTPTTLQYTTSVRQLNYIVHWCESFDTNLAIGTVLVTPLREFADKLKCLLKINNLYDTRLDDCERRGLSMFGDIKDVKAIVPDYYGSSYEARYLASFASFAQMQRHRSISYQMVPVAENFYVPPILKSEPMLLTEWQADGWAAIHGDSPESRYPQGMMVSVLECGNWQALRLKSYERMCGCAQIETMNIVKNLINNYVDNCQIEHIANQFRQLQNKPRCRFGENPFNCVNGCKWGSEFGIDRDI